MIFSALLPRRAAWAAAGLALAGLMSWPLNALAFELPQLMRLLAAVPAGEATFVEKRHVRELDQVLESTGRLSFTAPDVFVRETLKPRQEKLAVNGNTVVMSRGSRSRTVQLDAVPEAQVMVEAIRGTLTGNQEVLDRHFNVQLSGSAPRWTLQLTPKDRRLRDQVSRIQVSGREALLDAVALDLPGGDRSEMRITPAPVPASPASSPRPAS